MEVKSFGLALQMQNVAKKNTAILKSIVKKTAPLAARAKGAKCLFFFLLKLVVARARSVYVGLEKAVKLTYSCWMAHFAQSLCLYLPYSFARYVKLFSHFFECSRIAVLQAETQA